MTERKYYYTNPETGDVEEISKECHDMMQHFRTISNKDKKIGRVMIFGTGSDINEREYFKNLFTDNDPK